MILEALDGAGGVDYLTKQAKANPAAFLSLVGKLLPREKSEDRDRLTLGELAEAAMQHGESRRLAELRPEIIAPLSLPSVRG